MSCRCRTSSMPRRRAVVWATVFLLVLVVVTPFNPLLSVLVESFQVERAARHRRGKDHFAPKSLRPAGGLHASVTTSESLESVGAAAAATTTTERHRAMVPIKSPSWKVSIRCANDLECTLEALGRTDCTIWSGKWSITALTKRWQVTRPLFPQ